MDNCIDKIDKAKYMTTCDLLKDYRCVPLSETEKEMYALVTSDGLYYDNVMPFTTKYNQSTLQRMINHCFQNPVGVET